MSLLDVGGYDNTREEEDQEWDADRLKMGWDALEQRLLVHVKVK